MNQRLLKNGENINSQDITLFCFPFAGGGASTYTSWIKKLKDKITVCPIQLPGREERIMEKPYTDMSELLRDLTDEIVIAMCQYFDRKRIYCNGFLSNTETYGKQ